MNNFIDHTNLNPCSSKADIEALCKEAKTYQFKTVCVHPSFVSFAKECLKGSTVGVTTVVGFPLGVNCTATKIFEAELAVSHGADDIDVVMNYGLLKAKEDEKVLHELKAIRDVTRGKVLKVIIETCELTEEEIVRACKICDEAEADFVKTSTGFRSGGATVKDVRLMKENFSKEVKASGGIRDRKTALEMVEAGATRIGASAGIQIVKED
ncbi:deoxyribose-phosphate aldolase [Guggenheimella bovis]